MKWVVGGVAVAVMTAAAWWLAGGAATPDHFAYPVPGERHPYTVEVLNGTDVDGLAREITRTLRRRGIDVVYFGSASGESPDSTLLVVRRGDSAAARLVRGALGLGRIVAETDSSRLLDLTVVLGPDAATIERDP